MNPALRVLCTRPADHGPRPGTARLSEPGHPGGRRLDPVSLRAANALAGNAPTVGALEVAYVGPYPCGRRRRRPVVVRRRSGGYRDSSRYRRHQRQTRRDDAQRSSPARRGGPDRLALGRRRALRCGRGRLRHRARARQRIDLCPRRLGRLAGARACAGDRLPLTRSSATDRDECRLDGLELGLPPRFRAIAGPQSDHFSQPELAAFFDSEYTVCAGSDRMGMRLDGRPLDHARGFNITSDGIAPGSIQVPGSGQPIVLLADRQTTGGYPKIATVISADLPALGRVPIGARSRSSAAPSKPRRPCVASSSPRSTNLRPDRAAAPGRRRDGSKAPGLQPHQRRRRRAQLVPRHACQACCV